MAILNTIASWWMRKRMHQMELFMKYPYDVQNDCLKRLITDAADTEWGRKFGYKSIASPEQFQANVPLQQYETLKPFIDRMRSGEQNILWPTEIKWFAKSSGTTSDKSKFIPVSNESLHECHYNGGRDMVAIHCANRADTQLFTGKNLALAGSHATQQYGNYESYYGDLSAIVIQNLPMWAEFLRAPDLSIALMDNWEYKLDKIAMATMDEDITSLAGVPSWLLLVLNRILELKNKKYITEVWPNLEVFFHGGVNFSPYKKQFQQLFNSSVSFIELYNASEGFFGIKDQANNDELLLMLDYGIYYEFIPAEEVENENPTVLTLAQTELNKNYALVISTNAGLWRYVIGDTIRFTSIAPYRFVITGRTKQFINAFGEELIVDNAENALKTACDKTDAIIREYSVAPMYMENNTAGVHQWIIEFERPPSDIAYFSEMLDNALKALNSDYEAKRYNNFILKIPEVIVAPSGTYYNWMKSRNKLGAQNKVPRLSNNRIYADSILSLIK